MYCKVCKAFSVPYLNNILVKMGTYLIGYFYTKFKSFKWKYGRHNNNNREEKGVMFAATSILISIRY